MLLGLLFVLLQSPFVNADCSGKVYVTGERGTISEGPQPYSDSIVCEWVVKPINQNYVIALMIDSLITECGWDYLHVYDGENDQGTRKLGSFCGNRHYRKTDVVLSSSPVMYLKFMSDIAVHYDGFTLSYQTLPCPSNCTILIDNVPTCSSDSCTCSRTSNGIECESLYTPSLKLDGPTPRAGHITQFDSDSDTLYVFGGYNPNQPPMNDFYSYSFGHERWTVYGNMSAIQGRYLHASTLVRNQLYIHGGKTSKGESDELFVYSRGSGWRQINATGTLPPALYGHTLTYVPEVGKIFLFGGYSDYFGISNKFYSYDIAKRQWVKVRNLGIDPYPTYGHVAVYHEETSSIYFHGGMRSSISGSYLARNFLVYNIKGNKWISLPSEQTSFVLHHSATLVGNLIVFHGGYSPNSASTDPNQTCYSQLVEAYDIYCQNWIQLKVHDPDDNQIRMGHGLVYWHGKYFLVGGYNGKFFGNIVEIRASTPRISWDCAPTYCLSWNRCSDCTARPGCVWCQTNKYCAVSSKIADQYLNNMNATCSDGLVNCLVEPCLGYRSCGECLSSQFECSWCDSFNGCLPASVRATVTCPSSWSDSYCPGEYCDAKSSCSDCLDPFATQPINETHSLETSCRWCDSTNLCATPLSDCTVTPLASQSQCKTPCSLLSSEDQCLQSHRCMWCDSLQVCFGSISYPALFAFGQCQMWSLYVDISAFTTYESLVPAQDYHEFLVDIVDATSDIVVSVDTPQNIMSIQVQSLSYQWVWRGLSPRLTIRAYDNYRIRGLHKVKIMNEQTTSTTYSLRIELAPGTKPPISIDGGGFNVVYFISFFFLFLFSFLFLAIIIKKLRDILRYNQMRNEYLKARARRIIAPKFTTNLLDEDGQFQILGAEGNALPITYEYFENEDHKLYVAITFCILNPMSESGFPHSSISFGTTFCPVSNKLPSHQHTNRFQAEANQQQSLHGAVRTTMSSPFNGTYQRLDHSQSSNSFRTSQSTSASLPEDLMEHIRMNEIHQNLDSTDITTFPDELIERLDQLP